MMRSNTLLTRRSPIVAILLFSLILSSYQVIYDSELNMFYKFHEEINRKIKADIESGIFREKYPDKAHILLVYYTTLFSPVYKKVMRDGTEEE